LIGRGWDVVNLFTQPVADDDLLLGSAKPSRATRIIQGRFGDEPLDLKGKFPRSSGFSLTVTVDPAIPFL